MRMLTGLAELCAYFLRGGKKMKIYLTAELLFDEVKISYFKNKLYLCRKFKDHIWMIRYLFT